jgi:hypothetical protein
LLNWLTLIATKRAIMLRGADNGCSVRLARIGSRECGRPDLLAISLTNKTHAVVDHDNLDILNALFEPGGVPGCLTERTASLPAMSGSRQNEVMPCVFLSMNAIESLGFGRGSPIP